MTALKKKTVRTRRGVEPAGRPARREVERGRRARTNSSKLGRRLDVLLLRRRRPPPQIVLRSAIFLIRKGALRPPAGSAARARRRRARGP